MGNIRIPGHNDWCQEILYFVLYVNFMKKKFASSNAALAPCLTWIMRLLTFFIFDYAAILNSTFSRAVGITRSSCVSKIADNGNSNELHTPLSSWHKT